ncbi:short-chain dehydrogenase/reductase SDR [Labilithrix luteola]|uniref:Short-chain dehydrogenase/reductase SDR n=1 Tax=Labilithrix luteola TaxID=1391654 RepID=A0A0K1PQR0_9BACT|nr:SDR family oxidoreductase [Labilithrix luteola]AKU95454.1 short-chain dehydrogenase/reductase SDR [Labilithrix luteola]
MKNGKIRTYGDCVAVITGGASGIGRAIAEELARRGAAEIIVADLQKDAAAETATAIRGLGGRATVVDLDVRDDDAVRQLATSTFERFGRVDYVFNNAGTGVMGETHLLQKREWDLLIDVNIRGVANVVRAFYPRLVEQSFGHMVNTASCAGLMCTPFLSVYSATKHAVVGLSKAMRVEATRFGVRVSALCPGAVRTPLLTGGAIGGSIYELTDEEKLAFWESMKPGEVTPFARDTLDAVAKNEGIIVFPKHNRTPLTLFRLLPRLEETIFGKLHAKTLRDFPAIASMIRRREKQN